MAQARNTKRKAYKLDEKKTLELATIGVPKTDIAKMQGVAESTVYRFLDKIKPERQALDTFKGVIAETQLQAMAECTELASTIRRFMLDNRQELCETRDWRLLKEIQHAAEGAKHYNFLDWRLSTDQSTENQAVLVAAITDAKRRKVERKDQDHKIDIT